MRCGPPETPDDPGSAFRTAAESPGLVSIVGMGRSGSTFIEGQLAELYGGVAVGELVGVWGAFRSGDVFCSCGSLPESCNFWTLVLKMYPTLNDAETMSFMCGVNGDLMPIRHYIEWRRIIRSGGGRRDKKRTYDRYRLEVGKLLKAISWAALQSGNQFVIDSSKHPVFYSFARASDTSDAFSRLDALRLVRDPRGVIYSLKRPKEEATRGGVRRQPGYGLLRSLPYWWAMNTAGDRAVSRSSVLIRYEDLAENPHFSVMRDLGYVRDVGSMRMNRHQLIANPARHDARIEFKLDDRWRADRSFGTWVIGVLLYPWMRKYGYRF